MVNVNFKRYEVNVSSGELVSIIGVNGSGKTTFIKRICGKLNNQDLFINNKSISEYSLDYKKHNIACVFSDNRYNTESFSLELEYYLVKLFDKNECRDRINCFIEYFNLDSVYDKKIIDLTNEDRVYLKILSLLIIKPIIFCIDDMLVYLNNEKKERILNYIKENDIILFSVISNMEEILKYDKVLVINRGEKELFDDVKNVLKDENLFKELGLSLPFIYDISNLLKSYDLIENDHIIEKELVDVLWK